jgi:6,7-dimethyl-8-ribityllumazine synthase
VLLTSAPYQRKVNRMSGFSKILIVEASYYQEIADHLVSGAMALLEKEGCSAERIAVPGVFEVPSTIAHASRSNEGYAGYIALGCVIRGETDHYDHVCRETSRACMDLSVNEGLAVGFGILTCENMEQAIVRADVSQKNKGREAALACLSVIDLKSRFGR